MEINIYNLVIEVTRRCNMKCEHCLRGNAQDIDIDLKHLESLLDNGVESISDITFTGGEPTLVLNIITKIRLILMEREIEVNNFYVVINGTSASPEFIREMMEWYLFCNDNEISQVTWSNDEYHDESIINKNALDLLSCLRFASPKNSEKYPFTYQLVIPEGRAKEWGMNEGKIDKVMNLEIETYGDSKIVIQDTFYLNALGYITNNCDMSYESQKEYYVCHVSRLKNYLDRMVKEFEEEAA